MARTPPVITALIPPAAPLGSPSFTLSVYGTGYVEGDTIVWNGGDEPTTFVSPERLTTGVDMSTAEVAIPIPIQIRTSDGDLSNTATFALGEELPPLPSVPELDGWVLLADAYARPILLRVEEVAGIEEAYEVGDAAGPLYGKTPPPATAYRRVTFRSGVQFFVGKASLTPLTRAL